MSAVSGIFSPKRYDRVIVGHKEVNKYISCVWNLSEQKSSPCVPYLMLCFSHPGALRFLNLCCPKPLVHQRTGTSRICICQCFGWWWTAEKAASKNQLEQRNHRRQGCMEHWAIMESISCFEGTGSVPLLLLLCSCSTCSYSPCFPQLLLMNHPSASPDSPLVNLSSSRTLLISFELVVYLRHGGTITSSYLKYYKIIFPSFLTAHN